MCSEIVTNDDQDYYSDNVIIARNIFGAKTGLNAETFPEMWAAIFMQITSHIHYHHERKIPTTEIPTPLPTPVSTPTELTKWKAGTGKRANEEFASEGYIKPDMFSMLSRLRKDPKKKIIEEGYSYELSHFNRKDYIWRHKQ